MGDRNAADRRLIEEKEQEYQDLNSQARAQISALPDNASEADGVLAAWDKFVQLEERADSLRQNEITPYVQLREELADFECFLQETHVTGEDLQTEVIRRLENMSLAAKSELEQRENVSSILNQDFEVNQLEADQVLIAEQKGQAINPFNNFG